MWLEALHLFHSEPEVSLKIMDLVVADAQHAAQIVVAATHFVRVHVHG